RHADAISPKLDRAHCFPRARRPSAQRMENFEGRRVQCRGLRSACERLALFQQQHPRPTLGDAHGRAEPHGPRADDNDRRFGHDGQPAPICRSFSFSSGIVVVFCSVKNSRLAFALSRPMPESLNPPNGARTSRVSGVLIQMVPARTAWLTRIAVWTLLVQT